MIFIFECRRHCLSAPQRTQRFCALCFWCEQEQIRTYCNKPLITFFKHPHLLTVFFSTSLCFSCSSTSTHYKTSRLPKQVVWYFVRSGNPETRHLMDAKETLSGRGASRTVHLARSGVSLSSSDSSPLGSEKFEMACVYVLETGSPTEPSAVAMCHCN